MERIDKMELVLLAIELEDGLFVREAGFVLADLSFLTGIEYKTLSSIVLEMEVAGFIEVDRQTHKDPRRANRLISIRMLP